MPKLEKYYSNHARAFKFPWSIYHQPLLEDLIMAIQSIEEPINKKVLVIGPGDFFEFQLLEKMGFKVSVLDIDPRVIEDTRNQLGDKVENYYLVDEKFSGYPNEKFDLVYAKEVIEHITETEAFLKKLFTLGHAHSLFWLSTPNYGDWALPAIEKTFLELVARLSGFTRKGIHPRPFSIESLRSAFQDAGFEVKQLRKMPLKLSLIIWAKIPS
jgi:2-polyprenyl-3-methyl-5-hydroxy-6-metoxy-1,4-benzoquinol methylase